MKILKFLPVIIYSTLFIILGGVNLTWAQEQSAQESAKAQDEVDHSNDSDLFAGFETPMPEILILQKSKS